MNGRAIAMGDLNLGGAHGGELASAFGAGCVAAWAFLRTIVTGSLRSRIKELEEAREEDADKCERDLERQADRILQLEALLFAHGPQSLRNEIQAVFSEHHIELLRAEKRIMDKTKGDGK